MSIAAPLLTLYEPLHSVFRRFCSGPSRSLHAPRTPGDRQCSAVARCAGVCLSRINDQCCLRQADCTVHTVDSGMRIVYTFLHWRRLCYRSPRRRVHAQARLVRDRCQVHLSCDGLTRKGLAPLVGIHYAGRGRCSTSAWQLSDTEG